MVADGAGDDHRIADACIGAADVAPYRQRAKPGGGNEHPVALAGLDHLGIPGDHRHPRLAAGRAHRADDARELGEGEAFLEDEAGGKIERPRAHHRHIVDRAMHRQAADVAPRKEQRRNHVRIGAHHQTLARRRGRQHRTVVATLQPVVGERPREKLLDKLHHRPPAGAVGHVDPAVREVEWATVGVLRVAHLGSGFGISNERL